MISRPTAPATDYSILADEFADGDTALVDFSGGEYTFERKKVPAKAAAKAAS
ncbi:MAG: hypothetical protein Q7R32_04335 [Dehalococcoidia bacterium]|nr:hypothetical protein [Dehalococcoidia bacterium]